MRVATEPDRCVASGQCVMLAPTVFDQDDEGIVVLLKEHAAADETGPVRESALVCPARAITTTDD